MSPIRCLSVEKIAIAPQVYPPVARRLKSKRYMNQVSVRGLYIYMCDRSQTFTDPLPRKSDRSPLKHIRCQERAIAHQQNLSFPHIYPLPKVLLRILKVVAKAAQLRTEI